MTTQIDTHENVPEAALAPAHHGAPSVTSSVGIDTAGEPVGRIAADRPAQLHKLLGGWTWTPDPSEAEIQSGNTSSDSTPTAGDQLIRAFAWAGILIG